MTKKFGPTFAGKDYPSEMRTQLWPLCCGARIISGFKAVQGLTEEQFLKEVEETLAAIPDMQVFGHEIMQPKLTFLTLNQAQQDSKKIMDVVTKAGFVKFAEAKPRGGKQGFFIRDTSNTFDTQVVTKGAVKVA